MKMLDTEALAEAMGVKRLMIQSWKADSAWGVPIVDAEPVVRCKDCENWQREWSSHGNNNHYCVMIDGFTPADFYCADGERKDGADDETVQV